jgi:hypothetical protein
MASTSNGWCEGSTVSSFSMLRDHRFVDQHRLGVSEAAVQDTVTDGRDLEVPLVGLEPSDDELERALRIERIWLLPITGVHRLARGVLHDEAGLRADTLDLAAAGQVQGAGAATTVGGELHTC